jgi:hypothetical protein
MNCILFDIYPYKQRLSLERHIKTLNSLNSIQITSLLHERLLEAFLTAVSLLHTTTGAALGSITVAHYNCNHEWRCSRQYHCGTLQLYSRVALLTVVSPSHTTAVSTSGAAHGSIIVAHYSCNYEWRCSWQRHCRTTAAFTSDAAHGSATVAHYSCNHQWRCSWQCHCRIQQLHSRVTLLTAVSLWHTRAHCTGAAAVHYHCCPSTPQTPSCVFKFRFHQL